MEAPVKIRRTAITLAQKVQIILKLNNPSFKQKEIAQEYGLTASAISKIVKKKEGILEEWLRGGNLERKRKREGKNQTVDDALLSWFWLASKEEGPISGPVLMAKAKALADEMGVEFKPTNGWLCRWKNRNNLAYRRAPRERGEGRTAGDHRTGEQSNTTDSVKNQTQSLTSNSCAKDSANREKNCKAIKKKPTAEKRLQCPVLLTSVQLAGGCYTESTQEMLPGSESVSYESMMCELSLFSWSDGSDLTEVCKMMRGIDHVDSRRLFSKTEMASRRGHGLKAFGSRYRRDVRGGVHFPSIPSLPQGQWPAAVAGSSDSSSDEIPATGSAGDLTAATQHRPKRVKKEGLPPQSGPSCLSYTAPLDLRGQQKAPGTSQESTTACSRNKAERFKAERDSHDYTYKSDKDQREFISDTSDTSSDEASVKQAPTSQAPAQVKHEEPFCGGKQTHTQALQQRPLRGLYELPEGQPRDQCGGQMWDDSMFEARNQSCKGEKSYRKEPPLDPTVPAGCTDKTEQAATIALLRNAYFAAKEMIPSSSAGALNELCLLQGLGELAGQRQRPVEEFQQAIASVVEGGILERACARNCFGVLIDLPQDSRAFLYLRLLERAGASLEPRTYLLSVEDLRGDATAREVVAVLIRVLAQKGLDYRRMCGLALDGVAISAECREGVESELRARVPGLLCFRCLAHRLTLSCASAADSVPYLVKYQEVLHSLFAHLAELPQGRGRLGALGEVLANREETGGDGSPSEWLAARAPVDAVLREFGRLVSLLRDGGSARGAGLARALCSYKFLHCSHLLADVLHQLSILGRSCQRPDPDFSIVHPLLRSTVTTISKPSAGEVLKHFLAARPADGPFIFQGQAIRDSPQQRREAEAICAVFLERLTQGLRARFSEARDADVVTAMTAVFDPAHPPDSKTQHVHTLTSYLSGLGSRGEGEHFEMSCRQELVSFLDFVQSQPGVRPLGTVRDVCCLALGQRHTFPWVGSLAERFLSLPTPTDQLGALLGREQALRNRLGRSLTAEQLGGLLRIVEHGPPISEFNFKAAFQQLKLHEK